MRPLRAIGVVVLAIATVAVGWVTAQTPRVHACDVLSAEVLRDVLDWNARREEGEPERTGADATMCDFTTVGRNDGRVATVFEVHDGAESMYETTLEGGRRKQILDGDGYRAHLWRDEFLFLYAQGEYVNVNLQGFPAGSAVKLIPSIVARLKR